MNAVILGVIFGDGLSQSLQTLNRKIIFGMKTNLPAIIRTLEIFVGLLESVIVGALRLMKSGMNLIWIESGVKNHPIQSNIQNYSRFAMRP